MYCFKSSTIFAVLSLLSQALSSSSQEPLGIKDFHTPEPTAKWVHPGVLVSQPQLDFIRLKLAAEEEPWTGAYKAMLGSRLLSPLLEPTPFTNVVCGPFSKPNIGCTNETHDALAAYGNALAWAISGIETYALQSMRFMDAWSQTLQSHNCSNAPLQSGWAGSVWPRAGEIIRHATVGGQNAPWPPASIARFESMLRDASMGISIFIDDKSNYNKAMELFAERAPATIYLTSDGSYPKTVHCPNCSKHEIETYWRQSVFQLNGQAQETCRDLEHTGYGLASISHIAETSRIQGEDMFTTDIGRRLMYALELHTDFEDGRAAPCWLCNGTLEGVLSPITEVGYNALHTRLGYDMPKTGKYTIKNRPVAHNGLFVGFETLTHASNPR
ncbi:chondroitin AC/alginate lyase [Aspergillus flavus]|uniref:Chondroitin AC/alginate lyase n=1 Tax=Aspergillus flavus TaxID=5059 RepID=A0A5N6GIF2_ASPFL|nr:chondroitin AC/alginate lyase [Aspergillus flavus]